MKSETRTAPIREKWFEKFLEEEISLDLWNYRDNSGFPLWAYIRNSIATRLLVKENNFNREIHAPTHKIDYVFKHPIEHFRVLKSLLIDKKADHDACFFVPSILLMNDPENGVRKIDRIHSAYFNLFKKPLVFEISNQKIFSRQVTGVDPSGILYFPTIQILAKMMEQFCHFSISRSEHNHFLEIAHKTRIISKSMVTECEAFNLLKRTKARLYYYRLFVHKVAERVYGKKVFLNCGCYLGLNAILAWHFHDQGFSIIEPQHGYIGSNSHEYNYPNEIVHLPAVRKVFPDFFLTFGEQWGKDISIPSRIIPVGNKYVEDFINSSNESKGDTEENILVVSQGTVTKKMVGIAKDLARSFPNKNIIFKLHPGEIPFKERYQELEAINNIEIIGFKNILPLISKAKYIVGYNSTTLFEALAFPCKVVLCYRNSYTQRENSFTFFTNSKELVTIISKDGGNQTIGKSEYWKEQFSANVSDLL